MPAERQYTSIAVAPRFQKIYNNPNFYKRRPVRIKGRQREAGDNARRPSRAKAGILIAAGVRTRTRRKPSPPSRRLTLGATITTNPFSRPADPARRELLMRPKTSLARGRNDRSKNVTECDLGGDPGGRARGPVMERRGDKAGIPRRGFSAYIRYGALLLARAAFFPRGDGAPRAFDCYRPLFAVRRRGRRNPVAHRFSFGKSRAGRGRRCK